MAGLTREERARRAALAAEQSAAGAADSAASSQEDILGGAPGASEDQPATADSESPATPAETTGEDGPEDAADSLPASDTAVATGAGDSGPAVLISPEPGYAADDPRPVCGVEGEATPAYLAWLRRNDPGEYAAACVRLKITPETE